MAKKKKHKAVGSQKWQPQPNDAIQLAALRWFALEMERISIQIYATDKRQFTAMEKVFRHTLGKLNVVLETVNALSDDDCPEGYIRCKDGTCAPACDGIIAANNES